jgi:hypothetical protein
VQARCTQPSNSHPATQARGARAHCPQDPNSPVVARQPVPAAHVAQAGNFLRLHLAFNRELQHWRLDSMQTSSSKLLACMEARLAGALRGNANAEGNSCTRCAVTPENQPTEGSNDGPPATAIDRVPGTHMTPQSQGMTPTQATERSTLAAYARQDASSPQAAASAGTPSRAAAISHSKCTSPRATYNACDCRGPPHVPGSRECSAPSHVGFEQDDCYADASQQLCRPSSPSLQHDLPDQQDAPHLSGRDEPAHVAQLCDVRQHAPAAQAAQPQPSTAARRAADRVAASAGHCPMTSAVRQQAHPDGNAGAPCVPVAAPRACCAPLHTVSGARCASLERGRSPPRLGGGVALVGNWAAHRSLSRVAVHGSCSPARCMLPRRPQRVARSVRPTMRRAASLARSPPCPSRSHATLERATRGSARGRSRSGAILRATVCSSVSGDESDNDAIPLAADVWHGRALERALAQVECTLSRSQRSPGAAHSAGRQCQRRRAPYVQEARLSEGRSRSCCRLGAPGVSECLSQAVRCRQGQGAHELQHWADEPGVFRVSDARARSARKQEAAQQQQQQHEMEGRRAATNKREAGTLPAYAALPWLDCWSWVRKQHCSHTHEDAAHSRRAKHHQ